MGFFEQMKGRGVRVIRDDDLRGVNPGEHVHKDRFVIVDTLGVCEHDKLFGADLPAVLAA